MTDLLETLSRSSDPHRVGLVGLGVVGRRVLAHLVRAGFQPIATDLNVSARESAALIPGATIVPSLGCLGAVSSCLLSLPTPLAVVSVASQLYRESRTLLVVDLSTNSPSVVLQLGREARSQGIGFVDAPLTGGVLGAEHGTMTAMVGGNEADVNQAIPVLTPFCSRIVRVGPLGHGAMAKLLHNMVGEVQVQAFAEALAVATRLGLDRARFLEVLSNGMATSRILTEVLGRGILSGSTQPGASVDGAAKDQALLLQMTREAGLELTFTPGVYERLQRLQCDGYGAQDVSVTLRLFERMHLPTVEGRAPDVRQGE